MLQLLDRQRYAVELTMQRRLAAEELTKQASDFPPATCRQMCWLGLHISSSGDEVDTQISQQAVGNRDNP